MKQKKKYDFLPTEAPREGFVVGYFQGEGHIQLCCVGHSLEVSSRRLSLYWSIRCMHVWKTCHEAQLWAIQHIEIYPFARVFDLGDITRNMDDCRALQGKADGV